MTHRYLPIFRLVIDYGCKTEGCDRQFALCGDSAVYPTGCRMHPHLLFILTIASQCCHVYITVLYFFARCCVCRRAVSAGGPHIPRAAVRFPVDVASTRSRRQLIDASDPIPISTQQHSFTVLVRSGHNFTRATPRATRKTPRSTVFIYRLSVYFNSFTDVV